MSEEVIEYFHALIAGKSVEIECRYRDVFRTCRDYLAKFDTPDILIPLVTPEELDREREAAIASDKAEGKRPLHHSDPQLETMAVCRKLAEALLPDGILLFHAAAIAAEGRCYLFLAKSGTGKTTHIQKWLAQHPECFVVNGDKPFVDCRSGLVYGSPWCGKERMGRNTAVPLGGLVWLDRGEENEIAPIPFADLLPCLLQQCHFPNPAAALSVMRLLGLLQSTPCWRLKCNLSDDAGAVSYHAIVKQDAP